MTTMILMEKTRIIKKEIRVYDYNLIIMIILLLQHHWQVNIYAGQ